MDGNGLDRQLEAIKQFCDQNGYKIQEVYEEQISGTTDENERPELAASMVTAILENGCDTIIVESLSKS